MIIFLLALIATLAILAILSIGRLVFGRREKFDGRTFVRWLVGYGIFNYIFCFLILYFGRPALTGPFGGWQWILWPLFFSSIGNLFAFARPAMGVLEEAAEASQSGSFSTRTTQRNAASRMPANYSRRAIAAGIFGLVVVGVLGIAASALIGVFTTWFDVNAKALAAIPNVRTHASPTLPPTDPNHIVLVSKSVAAYKGQQVLGSNGQNLGSAYSLDADSYTLQSIKHHLYYVAPLSYNNLFVNLSSPTTPGFVVVDAENPQAVPQLYTDPKHDSLAVLPGALLNQDLLRHVYMSGYTNGRLLDPTLELDDNFRPYWTISLMQPIRGYVGNELSEVLLVDAHTGDITKYKPQDVPNWVDRVMPADTVTQYLQWWGLYHAAPWFNPSGLGQQSPASDPELLYNNVDQPVWLIPMTSSSVNDNSSTGIFLFDTHKNAADFYPLSGLGIGDNVAKTFQSTRANIRGYDVASVQLYQIYNTPTWVAIYVQHTSSGDIFQAVGIVDARNLNGSNVQFDTSLAQALQDYQQWLTQLAQNGTSAPSSATTKTLQGKVQRVATVQQGSNTVFYLQIEGQQQIFTANLSLSPKLPLVQSGDIIKGNYLNTGGTVVNFTAFDDLSINLGGSNAPPVTPTVQPTVTPAATPTRSK
ncbi:hypothetical protein EPA93_25095 [Ktedonosporobacter rubrisoli]|uniref:CvpA family protein n=1 Tax=Ktedonosporobacter rubrisoli TaxID=2509675 RepID=A0A4P6JUR4_KTERU|nr:hypothetical protein [Ktedonosporobacter rubrisoli]QBD79083.1 hypothetical protein EPA93_25095 [Ktedonosporobacter rubrisoli]